MQATRFTRGNPPFSCLPWTLLYSSFTPGRRLPLPGLHGGRGRLSGWARGRCCGRTRHTSSQSALGSEHSVVWRGRVECEPRDLGRGGDEREGSSILHLRHRRFAACSPQKNAVIRMSLMPPYEPPNEALHLSLCTCLIGWHSLQPMTVPDQHDNGANLHDPGIMARAI
jgi:hypothetical protein